ncbi:hypothetical protein GIB67_039568, partial [Kingdonia uniflora]
YDSARAADPEEAEVILVIRGMEAAHRLGIDQVLLLTDYQRLAKAFRDYSDDLSWGALTLAPDITIGNARIHLIWIIRLFDSVVYLATVELGMEFGRQEVGDGLIINEDENGYSSDCVQVDERFSSYDGADRSRNHVEKGVEGGLKINEASNERVEGFVEDESMRRSLCIGMEFDSQADAYNFYNLYAGKVGFSVRKYTSSKSQRTNDVIGRTFCCSLQGFRDGRAKSAEERMRNRDDTRTDCKARIAIRKRKGDKWVLTQFVEEHNHNLVPPSKRHQIRSLKKFTNGQEEVLQDMQLAGFKTDLMKKYMAIEVGGNRNIGTNAYFVGYLKRGISVGEFIKQFERAKKHRREAEKDAEFESSQQLPELRLSTNVEQEAASLYTREIFQKFQDQLLQVKACGSVKVYRVAMRGLHNLLKEVETMQNNV